MASPHNDSYSLAVQRQLHESDLFWTRNNAFLLVEGVLLSFYATSADVSKNLRVIPVLAGLLFCGLWFLTLRRGKRYVARWETVIARLEKEAVADGQTAIVPLLQYFHAAQAAEPSSRFGMFEMETSQLMQLATAFTAVLWVFAGLLLLGVD